jgi:ATP-dependent DNA helicase RecG
MSAYSDLDRPVQFLKGVGPQRAGVLQRLGLLTARDVLYHVPRRYADASTVHRIASLEAGMDATVVGRVVSAGVLPTRGGLRIFQAVLRDRSGMIECSWPGQPFLDRVIRRGDLLLVSGPVRFFHGRQLQPREFVILSREGEESPGKGGTIFPIYPATEGLNQRSLRKLIADNLEGLIRSVAEEEALPLPLMKRAGVPPLPEALEQLHRPASLSEAEAGRRRLALEELFLLQLVHARAHRESTQGRPGIEFARKDTLVKPLFASLPFELTPAQVRVLREIGGDMCSPRRMHRLLQGDVGSGKTVVALFAMLRAVENGYQAALMAPTEILAEQHVRTLRSLLGDLPVQVRLLTGRLRTGERRAAMESISSGEAQLVVGTQALIQSTVSYQRLGLVVVDEQHRFGVRQRLALAELGAEPDVLVMSATPIPRSLALTLYGDLDISLLDERPAQRKRIRTVLRPQTAEEGVLDFIREQVGQGRQAYLVYPLVEESETLDLRSATEEFERLSNEVFGDLRLALLHGQMPAEEKDAVMRSFAAGEVDVLVSTTVVEVGIDVANATVMVVQHAERFGLSQLHQLRGRVGRGDAQSYCILLLSHPQARGKLGVFTETDDGFRIAEADLQQRGQGDLFGARQSGAPAFRFADLQKDHDLLLLARDAARVVVDRDPEMENLPLVREALQGRYGERGKMFSTG